MRESSSSEVFPHSIRLPMPTPPPQPEWYSLISKSFLYTRTHSRTLLDWMHWFRNIYYIQHSIHCLCCIRSIKEFYLSTLRSNIIYWVNSSSELIEHWPIPNLNLFMWRKSFRNRNFTKKEKNNSSSSNNTSPCLNILMVISLSNGVLCS